MQIRRLFEGSPMGILVSEPSGRILFCNQRHADILGISAVEALGRNARDFHLEPERRDRAVAEALATGRPVSAEIPRLSGKDGLRWYRVTWAHQIFAGRHALVAWTLDVTDRHAADEAAAQARQAAPIPQPGEAMA
ncbi:MAG: PAS domain-containing protein [Magnetospirillum sp.]|nr:PAS domain-containing protein [Magnetospirillum sp.]